MTSKKSVELQNLKLRIKQLLRKSQQRVLPALRSLHNLKRLQTVLHLNLKMDKHKDLRAAQARRLDIREKASTPMADQETSTIHLEKSLEA
jgi:hypothetical protein